MLGSNTKERTEVVSLDLSCIIPSQLTDVLCKTVLRDLSCTSGLIDLSHRQERRRIIVSLCVRIGQSQSELKVHSLVDLVLERRRSHDIVVIQLADSVLRNDIRAIEHRTTGTRLVTVSVPCILWAQEGREVDCSRCAGTGDSSSRSISVSVSIIDFQVKMEPL